MGKQNVKENFSLPPTDNDSVLEVDGLGRTALMYAVHFGYLDTVQTLLHNGIDVDATAHGK